MELELKNGKKINYEIIGEGNPIVILHGWLASLETMRPLANYLSKNFKVYLVDIIGFGKSDLPDRPYNTNDFGDFLKEFIERLNIDLPILIGHSHGGKTIINCVGRKLIKARRIVLIDSTGIKPKRSFSYYYKIYLFKTLKNLLKILPNAKERREKLLSKFGSSDYKNSPEVLRKTMSIIVNEGQEALLPNIINPTLLIWGKQDTATPIADAEKMKKLIPDCGLVSYDGAGHYSYLDKLNQTLLVLEEFFKEDRDDFNKGDKK